MDFTKVVSLNLSAGGTVGGDLTISGDLTVDGNSSGNYDEIINGNLDLADNNITNVGDISLDTISADNGTSLSFSNNWTNAGRTVADLGIVTTVDINGGTVNGITNLSVVKASSGATATSDTVATIEDDDNTELSILGGSSSVLAINFGHSGDNDDGRITYNTTSGSETMQFTTNGAIRATIDKDGLLGIGCTPTDEITIDSTSDPAIVIKRTNASTQINKILTDSAGLYFQSYGHATGGNNQIIFQTEESDSSSSPTERLRIESQGSVGVGLNTPQVVRNWTAPDSIKVLNVYGSAGSRVAIQGTDASLDLVDYGATANRRWFSIYNNDDSVYFRRLQDDASSYSDILALNLANGNTTIKGKLTIEVSDETPLHIRNTDTGGGANAYLTIENDGGADCYLNLLQGSSNGYIKYTDEGDMIFQTAGMNDRLSLDANGAAFTNTIQMSYAGTGDKTVMKFIELADAASDDTQNIEFWADSPGDGNIRKLANIRAYNNQGGSHHGWISFGTMRSTTFYNDRFVINSLGDVEGTHGTYHDSSDERLKQDITQITDALTKVKGIRGVTFNWKDEEKREKNGVQVGVIAQEIEAILPEAVNTQDMEKDGSDYKSVSDGNQLTALLIEAIKELSDKVTELENK